MQAEEYREAELTDHLKTSLDFPKSTRFDLCLFWDFLNYLDDKALRALNTALTPHLHKTTRAHAFTVRTLETSFANQQYGIEQAHMFSEPVARQPLSRIHRPFWSTCSPPLISIKGCCCQMAGLRF